MFKVKDGYKLELQNTSKTETIWQHKKVNKQNKKVIKSSKSWSSWGSFIVQCNILDNQYQQKSEVLYTFNPNKSDAYLLNVEPSNLMSLINYNGEFGEIIITFTAVRNRR